MPPTERPILVSGPLVGPILRGEKTVTRRLVLPATGKQSTWLSPEMITGSPRLTMALAKDRTGAQMEHPQGGPLGWVPCPFGAVGDVLWVRETWSHTGDDVWSPNDSRTATNGKLLYRADGEPPGVGWFPSIHMPRWAARIFLRVESVTVERVQDITEEDARREGVAPLCTHPNAVLPGACEDCMNTGYSYPPLLAFMEMWDSLAPAGSKWANNPWVWRIAFRRVSL